MVLQDVLERQIGGFTVKIDRLLCVGFGDCIEEAAEAFEFDADGIVAFKDGADTVTRERLITACDSIGVGRWFEVSATLISLAARTSATAPAKLPERKRVS